MRALGISKSSLFLPKRGMQDQSTLSVTRSLRGRAAPACPCRLSGVERAKLTRTDGLRGPEKVRQMAAKAAGHWGPTPSGDCLVLPRAPGRWGGGGHQPDGVHIWWVVAGLAFLCHLSCSIMSLGLLSLLTVNCDPSPSRPVLVHTHRPPRAVPCPGGSSPRQVSRTQGPGQAGRGRCVNLQADRMMDLQTL